MARKGIVDTAAFEPNSYLQLVNIADTKLYDSTQFFKFGLSIYDLSPGEQASAKSVPAANLTVSIPQRMHQIW